MEGTRHVEFHGVKITYYNCRDCGCVYEPLKNNTMRPNNKFCSAKCMMYVISEKVNIDKRPRGYEAWLERNMYRLQKKKFPIEMNRREA